MSNFVCGKKLEFHAQNQLQNTVKLRKIERFIQIRLKTPLFWNDTLPNNKAIANFANTFAKTNSKYQREISKTSKQQWRFVSSSINHQLTFWSHMIITILCVSLFDLAE